MADAMQKMDFTVEVSDRQKEETRELTEQLLKDPEVLALAEKQNIPLSVIASHPWTVDEWRRETAPCRGCRGLAVCRARVRGYQNMLVYDGILKKVQTPCRFQKEQLDARRHLKNYLICDLPRSMETVSFYNISTDGEMSAYLKAFSTALDASGNGEGLYLYGPMGMGKTYLAACACNEKARQGDKVAFVYWPDFVQRMASMVVSGEYRTEMERLKFARFAVIDDIGAESVTEWNRDQLLLPVLNARYEAGLTTWFTSNEDLKSLRDHFRFSSKGDQADVKAERILDRIKALSKPEALTGKYRRGNRLTVNN